MDNLHVGDYVFFAREVKSCDVYEVLKLKLRTVDHNTGWFVGFDVKTKITFLFNGDDIGKIIFINENDAKSVVKTAKKTRKEVN